MKEKKVRQYRRRQGRSDKQYESNLKAMTYGCIGLLAILTSIIIYGVVTT